MSNLTHLADRAERRAEQAERTASRHQERVDLWEARVDERPRGSAARRRAQRRLERTRTLRDRAAERARRQRRRETEYRRRARLEPPAPPRPPRGRWVPQTPMGKGIAAAMIGAGVVTGIAIGGAHGFDPFDDDSQVVVETDQRDDGPVVPPPGADGGSTTDHTNTTNTVDDTSTTNTVDDSKTTSTVDDTNTTDDTDTDDDTSTTDDSNTVDDTTDTSTTSISDGTTTVIVESEAGSDEFVDEEYEWLLHECFALLDAYPDIEWVDPTITDWCVSDPAGALVVAGDLAAEIDALNAEYHFFVEQCRSMIASYPELDSPFGESCYQDPWGTLDAIDQWLADEPPHAETEVGDGSVDELEAYAIAVDACYAELEAWSFLVDIDPTLVDGCHQDPEATLVVIDQYLDVRD